MEEQDAGDGRAAKPIERGNVAEQRRAVEPLPLVALGWLESSFPLGVLIDPSRMVDPLGGGGGSPRRRPRQLDDRS
jgi:hypothetical protein